MSKENYICAADALERPFKDPITLTLNEGSRTPPHCRALLDLQRQITGTRPAADWDVLQQQLADCTALQWLARATVPLRSAMPKQLHSARETRLWPASVWPTVSPDEMHTLARAGQTLRGVSAEPLWQIVAPGPHNIQALRIASRGYLLRVQWLARGDFDGDGNEDWLLRWQAQAEGGSWRAARSVLLTRRTAAGPFSMRDLP